eukprot:1185218-Prorocentrum_minimum.AAC.3
MWTTTWPLTWPPKWALTWPPKRTLPWTLTWTPTRARTQGAPVVALEADEVGGLATADGELQHGVEHGVRARRCHPSAQVVRVHAHGQVRAHRLRNVGTRSRAFSLNSPEEIGLIKGSTAASYT